MLKILTWWG